MKITHVSTYAMANSQNMLRQQMQYESIVAGQEAVTGQYYDKSLILGETTNRYINNSNNIKSLENLQTTNNLLAQRMKAMQAALDSLTAASSDGSPGGALTQFNNDLMTDPLISTPKTIQASAQNALNALVTAMNTSFNGEYVFGGSNVTEKPMEYYDAGSGEGASKIVQDAFETYKTANGITDNSQITPEQMDEFLDGAFNDLFKDPSWNDNFSNANDVDLTNRISSTGEDVTISISANEVGFRNAMKNLVMVAEFGNIGLNDETQAALAVKARESDSGTAMATAITDIIASSANLGNSEQRVSKANELIDAKLQVYKQYESDLVGVDTQEAATRMTTLETMLSVSASITQKLASMSLVNYL